MMEGKAFQLWAGETRVVAPHPTRLNETLPCGGVSFFWALHRSTTMRWQATFGGFHPPYVLHSMQHMIGT